ncbi:MAG: SAM-dependent methyltransferase [Desulforhopalus sp.]|jgi:SAM-dependent methyltransferase
MTQKSDPTSETLSYYSENATKFAEGTVGVDMREFYDEFLPLLPEGGTILDAGCGSGRDTKYFLEHDYDVVAFDNCPEIVTIASEYTDHNIQLLSFSDVNFIDQFDGVWACASLLHVSSDKLPHALLRLSKSLKPNGILYTSFKFGIGEVVRGKRFFRDYTESSFDNLLKGLSDFKLIKYWKTSDLRPGRQNEKWLNILVRKI